MDRRGPVRRDTEKFADMLAFAQCLPAVRATVKRRLGADAVSRERVLALALRLLDVGFFRVGWDRYARDHGHVGLTTLRCDQVQLLELAVRFDYVAKAGKRRRMTVRDAQAVSALGPLKRRRSGPPELLAYRANAGWRRMQAADVHYGLRCWARGPLLGEGVPHVGGNRSRRGRAGPRGRGRAPRPAGGQPGRPPTLDARLCDLAECQRQQFNKRLPQPRQRLSTATLMDKSPWFVLMLQIRAEC